MVSQKKDKGFTPEGTGTMTGGVYGQRVQQALKWKCSSLSHIQLFGTPRTVACQTPPSMGFSQQEYWSGLPFRSPGIFPIQRSKLGLLHCRLVLDHLGHQGSPNRP